MSKSKVIAIASGKGGTGKTTVATSLAYLSGIGGGRTCYIDCDVEEPNGHIFLKPQIDRVTNITTPVPVVDEARCTACGKCAGICQFSAIALLGAKLLTFPNLCHGCGGCVRVCPANAISETGREVGVIEEGTGCGVGFVHGRLRVSEAMSPPLIRKVKEKIPARGMTFIDAPPGTSCPVIQSVKGTDFVLLVTEPTPFGLNDLKLAVDMLRELALPFGVVVNRAGMGDGTVFDYCRAEDIDVLLEIPDDRKIAEAYARGVMAAEVSAESEARYRRLLNSIRSRVGVDAKQ